MIGWVLLWAALAGGVGAGLRYLVDEIVTARVFAGGRRPGHFPVGILVVNVTGSFTLGLLTGLGTQMVDDQVGWIVGVGLLGGYTTFSTVSLDSVLLAHGANARRGWMNAGLTLVLGVASAAAGLAIGHLF